MKQQYGIQVNFIKMPENIKMALLKTQNVSTSLLGKILLAKALGISKLTYKLSYLATPSKIFDKIVLLIINSVWGSGRHKVSRSQLYSKYEHAGFNMTNLYWYDLSLKISMLNRFFLFPDEFWVQQLSTCLRIPLEDILISNISPAQVKQFLKPNTPFFWKATLKCWVRFHYINKNSKHVNINNIANIRLQYYMDILPNTATIKRKTTLKYLLTRFGLIYLKDLLNHDKRWHTLARMNRNNKATLIAMYNKVPQVLKEMLEGKSNFQEVDDHANVLMSFRTNSKYFYQVSQDRESSLPDRSLRY